MKLFELPEKVSAFGDGLVKHGMDVHKVRGRAGTAADVQLSILPLALEESAANVLVERLRGVFENRWNARSAAVQKLAERQTSRDLEAVERVQCQRHRPRP